MFSVYDRFEDGAFVLDFVCEGKSEFGEILQPEPVRKLVIKIFQRLTWIGAQAGAPLLQSDFVVEVSIALIEKVGNARLHCQKRRSQWKQLMARNVSRRGARVSLRIRLLQLMKRI